MAKLSSTKASQTERVIVFGPPKAGKSLIAGELAEHFNIIWVDMENGHGVLYKLAQAWQERIELINLKDTRSYPIAIETVLKMVKGKVSICEEHGKVSCMLCRREVANLPGDEGGDYFIDVDLNSVGLDTIVVFDSVTQLSSSAIANITKSEPDDYKMKTDDWGNLAKLMEIFLSHVQQASYNVVCISHEVEATTEGKKNKLVPVGGSKNSSRNVAKYFDHVIYAEVKNRKHTFSSSTTYNTTILTGSRTDVCLESLAEDEKPSLLRIFKPEVYKAVGKKSIPATKTAAIAKPTAKQGTNKILERLKARKNSQ